MSKIHPMEPIKKFISEQFEEKAVVLCQFCGGQSCPQEDYTKNTVQPNAIQGLHSNWITNEILAMQRPSHRLIRQFGLYDKFKKQKINTILNLQQPGEHPFCGDGLLTKVGFSYSPEQFFANGILFFNESWQDMTATTFEHMMRIMNIFYLSIVQNGGKISVHCHAGRGRTLLVICSWLIYHDRYTAKQTIDLAVERRQGVLTKASQREFLYQFEQQLKKRWKVFSPSDYKNFSEFVSKQSCSLLKNEQKFAELKPYIHANIVNQLTKRLETQHEQIINSLAGNHQWSLEKQNQLAALKTQINQHNILTYKEAGPPIKSEMLVELLYDFYDELPFTLFGVFSLEFLVSEKGQKSQKKLEILKQPELVHEVGVEGLAVMINLTCFLRDIVKSYLNIKDEQSEGYQKCETLFIMLAITLSTKRKYLPKLFSFQNGTRVSKLYKCDQNKREKYVGKNIIKLADFLRCLARQLPEDPNQIDAVVMKIRKIDANLHYYTKHSESQQKFFKEREVQEIYEKSKI